MGSLSVLVATPWLINNYLLFNNIMPISGQSESLTAQFGHNASFVPPILVENFLVFLPIPSELEQNPYVIGLSLIFVLGVIWLLQKLVRYMVSIEQRWLFALASIYAIGLCAFYGLYFGAEYFMPRYLYPFTPFTTLVWAIVMVWFWQRVSWHWSKILGIGLMLTVIVGLHTRNYLKSNTHPHFQVVNWVKLYVPTQTWVGAYQSGTIGYFHDHTINLDGKVNPEALRARKQGQLNSYIVQKPIEYIADWRGKWQEDVLLNRHFSQLVNSSTENLAVLKRKPK
jgi:hypothetical protein